MCANATSHVSKLICEFFEHKRFIGDKIMEWPQSSLDQNPTKNIWSNVKIKLCEVAKQYNSRPMGSNWNYHVSWSKKK